MKKREIFKVVAFILFMTLVFVSTYKIHSRNWYKSAKEDLKILDNMTPEKLYQEKRLKLLKTVEDYEKKL